MDRKRGRTSSNKTRSNSGSHSHRNKTQKVTRALTRKSLAMPNWPETLILLISTHGNIICENDVLKKFILPPGIELERVQMATPGEVNVASEEQVKGYASMINAHRDELLSTNPTTQKHALEKMVKRIRYHDLMYARAYKEVYVDVPEEDRDEHMAGYLEGLNRAHKITKHHSTRSSPVVLIDKLYSRTNEYANKNDWTIKVMNIPGQPDLLSFLKLQTRHGESNIYLKEVINECVNHGVKKLIMFDFSCGVFTDSELQEKPKREQRILRRRITTDKA